LKDITTCHFQYHQTKHADHMTQKSCFTFVLVLLSVIYLQYSFAQQVVGWWPAIKNSISADCVDYSAGLNNLTCGTGVTPTAGPGIGNASRGFSTSSGLPTSCYYPNSNYTAHNLPQQQYTFATWFRYNTSTSTVPYSIFSFGSSSTAHTFIIYKSGITNKFGFTYYGADILSDFSTTVPSISTWYFYYYNYSLDRFHVALTYDGSKTFSLFLNGQSSSTMSVLPPHSDGSGSIYLGYDIIPGTNAKCYAGTFSQPVLFSRILTNSEIAILSNVSFNLISSNRMNRGTYFVIK
jgi:hypothetical protein